jgi:hypothetical protein
MAKFPPINKQKKLKERANETGPVWALSRTMRAGCECCVPESKRRRAEREREGREGGKECVIRTSRPSVPRELLYAAHGRLRIERHRSSTPRDEQELHESLGDLGNDGRRCRRRRRRFHPFFFWLVPRLWCRWVARERSVTHIRVIACGCTGSGIVFHTCERGAGARGQRRDLEWKRTSERRERNPAKRRSGVILHR